MTTTTLSTALALAALALGGCRGAETRVTAKAAIPSAPRAEEPAAAADGHGTRRGKDREVPVRVDGKEVAMLRFGELPPGVAFHNSPFSSSKMYVRVGEYLRAVGVAPAAVRAVHFAGHRGHFAVIDGAELRKDEARFVFAFAQGTSGAPVMRWSTDGLRQTRRIDFIYGVDVYLQETPPALSARGCVEGDSGCVETPLPELPRGTRVYVDGRLVTRVKRRVLGEADTLPAALAAMNLPSRALRGVDFVAGDDLLGRLTKPAPADVAAVGLKVESGQHGQALARLPARFAGGEDAEATVTSIHLYVRKDAPPRDVSFEGPAGPVATLSSPAPSP